MGVLKVNVGDAVTPVWRKIGCGDPVGTNILTNPGAETGTTTGYSDAIDALALTSTTSQARSGTRSFQATLTGYRYNAGFRVYQGNGVGKLPCSAGVPITVGGYVKIDASPYYTEGVAWVRLTYYNASDGFISQDAIVQVPATDANWTLVSVTSTPPAGAASVIVAYYWGYSGSPTDYGSMPPGTAAYWDDLFFFDSPPPTGRLKLWDGSQWWREVCDDDTPTTLFSDDFTQADSSTNNLGGYPWLRGWNSGSDLGTWGINSNRGYLVSTSGHPLVYVDGLTDADVTVTAAMTYPTGSTGQCAGVAIRWDSITQRSIVAYRTGLYDWYSSTWLDTWTALPDNVTLSVTAVADALTVHADGVLIGSATSSSGQTKTKHGIAGNLTDGQFYFDDFTITTPAPIRRPLKVNVGTPSTPDWQVAACMTPAP